MGIRDLFRRKHRRPDPGELAGLESEAQLERLLEGYDLTRLSSVARLHALPSAGFRFTPQARGRSRLGGVPDLAEDAAWPEHGGRPLDFLMQVDLGEVRAGTLWKALPGEGLLGFFYDVEAQPWGFDPADRPLSRVTYTPPDVNAVPREAPAEGPGSARRGVEFFSLLTLPSGESTAFEKFQAAAGMTGEETDRYYDLIDALNTAQYGSPRAALHRFCGHSENVQGDMQFEAEVVRHGFNTGEGTHYEDPEALKHKSAADCWRLLLQLDSDEEAGLTWGDLGMLYFWMREDDVQRRDWSGGWTALQCT